MRAPSVEEIVARVACSVDGCSTKAHARRFCRAHYYSEFAKGIPQNRSDQPCSIDGCDRPFRARGLCQYHYDIVYYRDLRASRDKTRPTSPAVAASMRRAAAKFAANYPEKAEAKRAVRTAVECGDIIVPEACSLCALQPSSLKNGSRGIQAHHDDYSRPLDVRWLCYSCHAAVHVWLREHQPRVRHVAR